MSQMEKRTKATFCNRHHVPGSPCSHGAHGGVPGSAPPWGDARGKVQPGEGAGFTVPAPCLCPCHQAAIEAHRVHYLRWRFLALVIDSGRAPPACPRGSSVSPLHPYGQRRVAANAAVALFYPKEMGVEGKSVPKRDKCQIDLKHACLQLRLGRKTLWLSALGPDSVRPACCPLRGDNGLGTALGARAAWTLALLYGFLQPEPLVMSFYVSLAL